ncbi:hypothetical protein OZX57_03345 [Bifidobacterium sp. ESL0682]|uniref:hypothetical protein n=1 Tax=Bifidobacterium sp. ESL0682 TaxID=2983212 RepID=UPI0023F61D99|nr:hypothetical protein [Bifidobacterium sp. ESL0682]WEV42487.1 hypothetical protein OZX57_03345 [Bifidobacterium sp. ESL0682]
MSSVENQHRQRFAVIKQWSISGIERPRESFYVEEEFKQRLRENDCDTFFKPVQLNDSEDMHYNLEVSYLIDAFDELPHRVDLAFDSAWKALESALSFNYSSGNTTENLNQFVNEDFLESNDICDLLCKNIPIQSCEYLYNRLIEDSCREDAEKEKAEKEEVKTGKNKSKMTDADRLFNRLKLKENLGIGELIRVLKGRYKNGNGQRCEVHNGPRFIKKC